MVEHHNSDEVLILRLKRMTWINTGDVEFGDLAKENIHWLYIGFYFFSNVSLVAQMLLFITMK